MDGDSRNATPDSVTNWLPLSQQKLIALLVALSQLAIAGWWLANGGARGELIRLDQATPRECPTQLDINHCTWPELTLLPGISETMARRIIHDRQEHGHFRQLEDLKRVRGIGPKKLAKLRPHLVCRPRADEPNEKP